MLPFMEVTRYWQLLMLPYLTDCRNWQLLMLPFLEVTISGNYLCARSGNIGYYHSYMCNNVMYMYNKCMNMNKYRCRRVS